jgi:transcription elongation GreA/GreB family factor
MHELKKMLEDRKTKLVDLLENSTYKIPIEKQHQIYGAINEIDNMIESMSKLREGD